YPESSEKRIKEHSREHIAKEHMAKFYELPYKTDDNEFQKWLNDFTGFDIETEIDEFVLREKINVNIYSYSVENQTYYQSKVYKYNEDMNEAADESSDESVKEPVEVPDFNVLIDEAQNGERTPQEANSISDNHQCLAGCSATLIHAFYISNKETLTGLKFCPFCKQKAFDPKDIHFVAQYEKHIKKCEINEVEKIINKDFGKSSKQLSQLVPLSVASTIKNKQEAEQISEDNQYIKIDGLKDSEQLAEVPVVGFNSAKFDFALIFKNLQSSDWEIKSYIGSSSQAKSIIVKHKHSQIKLKFCDIMVYVQAMTLKDFAKNFGEEAIKRTEEIRRECLKLLEKGVFPYEYINTDNFNDVLNLSDPFPKEAFNSTLRNSSMNDDEYKNYLDDAKEFKNRWEYLQYYNEQDTKIMIAPKDNLIQMNFKYKIDMFSFMSMAACANAIKYALAYKDFDFQKCVRQ
ncbi:MAG: hypothetical protein EZS28_038737, partial [Streblomastix strix]